MFLRFFTLVEEGTLRTLFRRWVQAVTVALSYGAEEAVGQTNYQRWVCARGKGLRFQGVCTVRETTDVRCCLSSITNLGIFGDGTWGQEG